MGWFDKWYEQDSSAYGYPDQIDAGALVFERISEAMREAEPAVRGLASSGSETWAGESADEMHEHIDGLPLLMSRSAVAHADAATALRQFRPGFEEYQDAYRDLTRRGRDKANEEERARVRLRNRINELEAEEGFWDKVGDVATLGISDVIRNVKDPQARAIAQEIDRIEHELKLLEREFDANEESFEDAVKTAARLILDADSVLYNNSWDEFWTQTGEPVLQIIRKVLQIAALVLMLVMFFVPGLQPFALALAIALATTSALQIVGTAAAGKEVTTQMWVDFALDLAAVVTAGLAYKASSIKLSDAAKAGKASDLLKGKTTFKQAATYSNRLKWDHASKLANRAELFESALNVAEGGRQIHEGNTIQGIVGIAGGGLEIGAHGMGKEFGDMVGDGVKMAKGTVAFDNLILDGMGADWANEKIAGEPEPQVELNDIGEFVIEGIELEDISEIGELSIEPLDIELPAPDVQSSDGPATGSTEWPGLGTEGTT